jgi:hypothetical protein
MPAVRVDRCIAFFLQRAWGGVNPQRPRQVNARRKASSSTQIQFMVRRTTCQKRATRPAASGAKKPSIVNEGARATLETKLDWRLGFERRATGLQLQ